MSDKTNENKVIGTEEMVESGGVTEKAELNGADVVASSDIGEASESAGDDAEKEPENTEDIMLEAKEAGFEIKETNEQLPDEKECDEEPTVEAKRTRKPLAQVLLGVIVGVAITLVVLAGVAYYQTNNQPTKTHEPSLDGTVVMQGIEQANVLDRIQSSIDMVRAENGYIELYDSTGEPAIYLYNKLGELIADTPSGMQLFRNDGVMGFITDNGYFPSVNLDPLRAAEFALESVRDNKATLLEIDPTSGLDAEYRDEVRDYFIVIKNEEQIENHYGYGGNTLKERMVGDLNSGLGEIGSRSLVYHILLGKSDTVEHEVVSVALLVSVEAGMYTMWYYDGYMAMKDWSILPGFYEDRFADFEHMIPEEQFEELIDAQIAVMDKVIMETMGLAYGEDGMVYHVDENGNIMYDTPHEGTDNSEGEATTGDGQSSEEVEASSEVLETDKQNNTETNNIEEDKSAE